MAQGLIFYNGGQQVGNRSYKQLLANGSNFTLYSENTLGALDPWVQKMHEINWKKFKEWTRAVKLTSWMHTVRCVYTGEYDIGVSLRRWLGVQYVNVCSPLEDECEKQQQNFRSSYLVLPCSPMHDAVYIYQRRQCFLHVQNTLMPMFEIYYCSQWPKCILISTQFPSCAHLCDGRVIGRRFLRLLLWLAIIVGQVSVFAGVPNEPMKVYRVHVNWTLEWGVKKSLCSLNQM